LSVGHGLTTSSTKENNIVTYRITAIETWTVKVLYEVEADSKVDALNQYGGDMPNIDDEVLSITNDPSPTVELITHLKTNLTT
jgi:hypothetical protein